MKTKKVTISLTEEQQQQAKEISKELLGQSKHIGVICFLVNQHLKKLFEGFLIWWLFFEIYTETCCTTQKRLFNIYNQRIFVV